MRCIIHQPNFVPWYPFFQRAGTCDILAILTECQWEKGGWQNLFRLKGSWYTMRVCHGLESIAKKQYARPQEDWAAIKRRLPQYSEILTEMDGCIGSGLATVNSCIIRHLARKLGLKCAVVDAPMVEGESTERLVNICLSLGCTEYLSGPGGKGYMNEALFFQAGVKLTYVDSGTEDTRHTLEVL